MNISNLVRENVKRLKPFSSARAEFTGSADVLLDANESPYESEYNRYPDPYQKELKSIIASQKGIRADQIILGNGSDELIDLVVRTFCQPTIDIVRYISPSFGMYEVVADINEVIKEPISLDEAFDLDVQACLSGPSNRHKVLFLCSPNNPTGNGLSVSRLKEVITQWQGIVVLDEAYIEFSDQESLIGMIDTYRHLIILQTFSKALGGAGLRLGMGFADSEVIRYLNKIKPPYNVNVHTQTRAKVLLSQKDIIAQQIGTIIDERKRLSQELSAINGIDHLYPSDTNFLLMRCMDHMDLYTHLCEEGVIIRDRSKLEGCERCLRVTVGLPKENDKLIELIKQFYK